MSVIATTVETMAAMRSLMGDNLDLYFAAEDDAKKRGLLVHRPNTWAWFVDKAIHSLDPDLPRGIFSQAVGPSSDYPPAGDLSPEDCLRLARAIDAATSEDLCFAVLGACAPGDREVIDEPKIGVCILRKVARLATRAANAGGLTVT